MRDLSKTVKRKMSAILNKKQIILHHDNNIPHVALTNDRFGNFLVCIIFPRPITILLSLDSCLAELLEWGKIKTEVDVSQALFEFFAFKTRNFLKIAFTNYHRACKMLASNNRNYIVQ